MYTENPFGILTLQLPRIEIPEAEGFHYAVVSEVNVPLLEGGLIYCGALSASETADITELSTYVGRSVLESAQVRPVEPPSEGRGDYWVRLGYPPPDNPEEGTYDDEQFSRSDPNQVQTQAFRAEVVTSPDDPQQFSGMVTQETPGTSFGGTKFIYKDLRDLGFGTVIVIIVGIAATLCAINQITGAIANRGCKRVRVKYNFGFNLWGQQEAGSKLGCTVECLD